MKNIVYFIVGGVLMIAISSCEKEVILPNDDHQGCFFHDDNDETLKKGSPKTPIINVTDPDEDEDFDSPNKTNKD